MTCPVCKSVRFQWTANGYQGIQTITYDCDKCGLSGKAVTDARHNPIDILADLAPKEPR